MADVPIHPLEVFAVDENMNRASGTIPYTSLTWSRRYHECGQFSMVVPANVYDPSWAYVYADARPETGIVQKVEYSDTAHTPDGIDTVTVSGFFLECLLNRLTFLVEQPEEKTIEIHVPEPKSPGIMRKDMPTVYRDPDTGDYFYENSSGDLVDQQGNKVDGSSSWEEIHTEFLGQTKLNDEWGYLPGDMMSSNYNYKVDGDDGTIHLNSWWGSEKTYDIVMEDDKGNVYYYPTTNLDGEKVIHIANSVATLDQTRGYKTQKRAWDASGGVRYETITVKGPWQRTDTMEPITESDSVDQLFKWLQTFFGSTFKYEEPAFEGVTKTLDPSLQRMGDFAYSVLQEVGASLRVVYGFENDTMVFEVYRGLDRTQDNGLAEPVALMAASAEPDVPIGYEKLEYIQSTGTQYIDTGFKADYNTRFTADFMLNSTSTAYIFASRGTGSESYKNAVGILWNGTNFRSDYGSISGAKITGPTTGVRYDADKNKATCRIGTETVTNSSSSFSSTLNVYLFGCNEGGSLSYPASMRLWSFAIYDSSELVRDFVPAKRSSDGAVGLYDTVTGTFFGNSGTGAFVAGPVVSIADSLTYDPNGGEGSMDPTPGYVGDTVVVEANGFTRDGYTFRTWNTQADGGGTDYAPLSEYTLTAGADVLYAQWDEAPEPPQPEPGGPAPWAVFSDTWGTIYDYTASRDTSNYRNTCYVLYSYDQPKSFDSDGTPHLTTITNEDGTTAGWKVEYETKRGYQIASIKGDDGSEPTIECYLDLRESGGVPACDSEWSRDEYSYDETQPNDGKPTLPSMKAQYDEWPDALTAKGVAELEQNYGVVTNLDTGTVVTSGYMRDWDLGDLVEFGVSTVGLMSQARIVGVDEVYESGRADVRITVGDELLTDLKKAKLN